ncbi:MAG: hypothetical protein JNJ94_14720 [Chlorobi bacterium]|nr:hypothetical protein [Chlorobiota bacterium]
MLNIVVIHNGIHELELMFQPTAEASYTFVRTGPGFPERLAATLATADALLVPNGSDHVAMLDASNVVVEFLQAGKTLFCFDGWFTAWIPGNHWQMDNSRRTIEIRYQIGTDQHNILDGVAIDELIFNHGISGWWACGFITPAANAEVLLTDTWGRAMVVLDEATTPGRMILTSSGPLADFRYDGSNSNALSHLYRNLLEYSSQKIQP